MILIQACAKIAKSIAKLDTAIAEVQLLLGPDYRSCSLPNWRRRGNVQASDRAIGSVWETAKASALAVKATFEEAGISFGPIFIWADPCS